MFSTLVLGCGKSDSFSPEVWAKTPDGQRYDQAQKLVETHRLVGLTGDEVKRQLGPPSSVSEDPPSYEYLVQIGAAGFNSVYVLDIRFNPDGKVQEAFLRGD